MRKAHLLEDGLSALALLTMALLPLLEIVIRKFYASGIPGSATWVQHLALWVGFLGAAIAARKGEMLSLTAGSALLKDKWKNAADVFTTGVGFAVCAVLAKGSLVLVLVEREGGRDLALGLPVWVAQTIMPIGFSVIGIRILARLPGGWRARAIAASFVAVPILLGWTEDLPGSGALLPLLLIIVLATTLGAPIFVGLGGVAAVLLWNNYDPVSAIAVETYNLALKPILPTIPALHVWPATSWRRVERRGRLVRLFRSVFGWMPGGVAIVAIGVCAFFTSFTGGSGVTILAMGGLLYPMLLEEKYPEQFSSGLLTSAGSLGLLFPPSSGGDPLWIGGGDRYPEALRQRMGASDSRNHARRRFRSLLQQTLRRWFAFHFMARRALEALHGRRSGR